MAPMETIFLSHGGPHVLMDDSVPLRGFLKTWRSKVLATVPKAILIISGHWHTSAPTVSVVDPNPTIHDFYGFPKQLYQIKYPAPGAPVLAKRVKELLEPAGFGPVKEDKKYGLDHGAWVPLRLMYPDADVPVCQLSIQMHKDATYHYNLGKALAPLRDEGYLIIGSGHATHNMRVVSYDSNAPLAKWAVDFDSWLKDSLLNGRHDEIKHYLERAPNARTAHPTPDHFLPLHIALGAAGESAKAEVIHDSWTNSTFSYACFRFTTPASQSSEES